MKTIAGKIRDSRIERDSMGEVRVPAGALYGAQTQRAVENFPISNLRFPREFIRAMGLIKLAAAYQHRPGTARPKNRQCHHAGSGGSRRRKVGRAFRSRHLSNRL